MAKLSDVKQPVLGIFDPPGVVRPNRYHRINAEFPQLSIPDDPLAPASVHVNVQRAGVLEPLVMGPGKTTREKDLNPVQRLSYFQLAAVNVGESFRRLAERLHEAKKSNQGQPLLYDIARDALWASRDRRDGGRTNETIIGMLVPIIAAQILYLDTTPSPANIDQTFALVGRVLQNTNRKDVECIVEMTNLGKGLSGFPGSFESGALTVWGYYKERQKGEGWHSKYHDNFLIAQELLKTTLALPRRDSRMVEFRDFLTEATYIVFDRLPTLLPNGSHTQYWGPDLADDVAIVLYILFSHYPGRQIVF